MYELEANERANKAALLLAHERYTAQFAPFVKGQHARLSYVEDQIATMLNQCAKETNAEPEYVAERFAAFLRESVPSAIPPDSIGIRNQNDADSSEFVKTDVLDRGEVPGLGREEATNDGVEKYDLSQDSQKNACFRCEREISPKLAKASKVCFHCLVDLHKLAGGDDLAFTGDDMYEMYGDEGPDEEDVGALFHMWDKDMSSRIDQLKQELQATDDPQEQEAIYAEIGRLSVGIDKQPPGRGGLDDGEEYDEGDEPYTHENEFRGRDARKKRSYGEGQNENFQGQMGTGVDQLNDPAGQGLMNAQDPNMPYTCKICGRTGTHDEILNHVQTDHGDVLQRQQQQQQLQNPGTPQLQQPMGKQADTETQIDDDAARVEPLNETPGDHFESIVSDLAQRAAARHFSLSSEEQIQSIASQLGVPADEVRNSLVSIATFGNYVGVNGELGGESNPPEGYEAVSVQGLGNDPHQALVPTDLVVTKVAEDMNLEQSLAYNMIRDKYGADLPEQYHAQVQGQQQFYLPTELAQNQMQQQQAQPPTDPNVGPAFQQTPPGAPVQQPPAQQPGQQLPQQ